MSLAKFTKCIFVITFIALVYIHLQMKIIDFAYQGQAREAKIKDLIDRNGNTYYAISKMKSANHLGDILLTKNSKMRFVGGNDIITIASAQPVPSDSQRQVLGTTHVLSGLLSFATQAEARNKE